MKPNPPKLCLAASFSLVAACTPSQPAETETARAPESAAERVQVTPETKPTAVTVTPVGPDGKPVGEARVLQLTPEAGDPKDLGLVPVPAGSQ